MLNKLNFFHNLAVTLLVAAICPEESAEGGTLHCFIYIHIKEAGFDVLTIL
jgi:hypothetical protein